MNNSNNSMTLQDEILYREIIEEEVDSQIIQQYDEIIQLNEINNGEMTIEDEILYGEMTNQDQILYREIIQEELDVVNGDIGQGPIEEVNNEDRYDYLYNEIIQFNENNAQGSMMMANNDCLMDFGGEEDEIDIKIIEDYNRIIQADAELAQVWPKMRLI